MGSNAPDEAVTYPGGFGNLDIHVLANMVGSLRVSPPPPPKRGKMQSFLSQELKWIQLKAKSTFSSCISS
jgi:hypothetical protein